jgi:hypothetical protein
MGLARQAQDARRGRCGYIDDDEQRRDCPQPPCTQGFRRRRGICCVGAPRQCTALHASRRLASTPASLGTRSIVLLPQAASPHFSHAQIVYNLGHFHAAEAQSTMSTALRSIGLLDILFKYACGSLNRAPCIHSPLHLLATKPCEKCGLDISVKVRAQRRYFYCPTGMQMERRCWIVKK